MTDNPVILLALKAFELGMVAVGGYVTILPDLKRYVVEAQGWISADLFALLFAISVAAPGPNFMIVTLLGWTIGGVAGAVAATFGALLPTVAVALYVGLNWNRFRGSRGQVLATRTLAPIAVGMLLCTAVMLLDSTMGPEKRGLLIALPVAAYSFLTRKNPLWPMLGAALVGALGWVEI